MTWNHYGCTFGFEHLEEKMQKQKEKEERQQRIITTEKHPLPDYPHLWHAYITGDKTRCGAGDSEEFAVGQLWLMYSDQIIEKCKMLDQQKAGEGNS